MFHAVTAAVGPLQVLTPSVEITIIDDDEPGILVFDPLVVEALETASQASVCVKRQKGCDGRVTVDYRTLDMTAVKGEHYLETSGTLVFESNDAMQVITVRFPPGHELEVQKSFAIQLDNPTGGVQVSKRNKCVRRPLAPPPPSCCSTRLCVCGRASRLWR